MCSPVTSSIGSYGALYTNIQAFHKADLFSLPASQQSQVLTMLQLCAKAAESQPGSVADIHSSNSLQQCPVSFLASPAHHYIKHLALKVAGAIARLWCPLSGMRCCLVPLFMHGTLPSCSKSGWAASPRSPGQPQAVLLQAPQQRLTCTTPAAAERLEGAAGSGSGGCPQRQPGRSCISRGGQACR